MDKNRLQRLQENYIRNLLCPLRYLTQLKTKFNLGCGQIICENLFRDYEGLFSESID